MATPHVTGVAATYLQSHAGATPQQVADAITTNATFGYVTDPKGSPNLLLYGGHGPPNVVPRHQAVEENGTCDASCSLREAIDAANLRSGLDRIFFAIPGPAPVTITPASTLPAIESPVIIDATLQSGYVGNPLVELDGGSAPSSAAGLSIGVDGSGSTIRGLAIGHFGVGIEFESASSANVLEANYIGVGASGSTAAGNELGIFHTVRTTGSVGRPLAHATSSRATRRGSGISGRTTPSRGTTSGSMPLGRSPSPTETASTCWGVAMSLEARAWVQATLSPGTHRRALFSSVPITARSRET